MKRGLLLFFILFIIIPGYTQDFFLHHYSTREGLPSVETYDAYQDAKGYIWIASDMGVCRFNGYTFKTFTTADGLTDNTIFKFYEDYKGRIWCYTFSGRLCYFFNDSIYGNEIGANTALRDLMGASLITGLRVLKGDTVLLSSPAGVFAVLPQTVQGRTTWNNVAIISRENSILAGEGYVSGVFTAKEKQEITWHPAKHAPVKVAMDMNQMPQTLMVRGDSSLHLFLSGICIELAAGGRNKTITLPYYVTGTSFEGDTAVWLATTTGAFLCRPGNLEHPLRSFLPGVKVSSVFKDREEGYWFTTLNSGVYYLPALAPTYYNYTPKFITPAPTGAENIWCNNLTEICALDSLQHCADIFPGLNSHFPLPEKTLFWNVFIHSTGQIWVSSNGGIGVLGANKKFLHFIDLFAIRVGIGYDSRLLIEDAEKNVWSLNSGSLTKIDFKTMEAVKSIGLPSRGETMCNAPGGGIYVGTLNGLYLFKNDSLLYLGAKNPLFKNRIVDLKILGGRVIAATRGAGLLIIAADSVYTVNKDSGLLSDMCRSLWIGSDKTIWLGTNAGVNAISTSQQPFGVTSIQHYTIAEGLPSNDILQILSTGNKIWVLTKNGITGFYAGNRANTTPPLITITGVTTDGKEISLQQPAHISYNTNFVQINFTGFTYKNPGMQTYCYKLQGYDTTTYYTTATFVQFTKLPPGEYRFLVSCFNSAGIQGPAAEFLFTVNSPFYFTRPFIAAVIAFVILLTYIIIKTSTARIKRNERAKTEINRKIANLEMQALRAQMNPHFVFNCLNAIQDFIMSNDQLSAKRYLSGFARLIRKTLDQTRYSKITLADEIEFLELYLTLERMRFSNSFEFEITSHDINTSNWEVPSMIIQPFVENAIRHGRIGYMQGKGRLKINFNLTLNELICTVDDNGAGLHEPVNFGGPSNKKEVHAFDIINDRITTMNELQHTRIYYTIINKADKGTGESGVQVVIHIPVETNK